MMKNIIVIGLSIFLFVIGCTLPAFHMQEKIIYGWFAFVFGALSPAFFPDGGAWFANIFYFASVATIKVATKLSIILSCIGIVISLDTYNIHQMWINEAHMAPVIALGSGFYCWLSAQAVVLIYAIYTAYIEPNITYT